MSFKSKKAKGNGELTEIEWNTYETVLGRVSIEEIADIRDWTKRGYAQDEILEMVMDDRRTEHGYRQWQNYGNYADIDDDYMNTGYGGIDYGTQYRNPEENVWKADTGMIKPCEMAGKAKIFLPQAVWRQICAMTLNTKSEWLGYMDYTVEGDTITVTGLAIPKQKVTSAEVELVEPQVGKGVIHAHPGGGVPSFSSTDDATLNPNNEFSIVISRDLRMTAVSKAKLPCGAMSLVHADVAIEGEAADLDFYEQNKAKLLEGGTTVGAKAPAPTFAQCGRRP